MKQRNRFQEWWWRNDVGEFLAIMGSVLAIAVGLTIVTAFGLRQAQHYFDSRTCEGFAEATGREVRFTDYHFWNWGCLTPAADGSWIEIENLRLNEESS